MKRRIRLICLVALTLISCDQEEFLSVVPETTPSSATFFTTQEDFQQAVNGAYVPLRAIVNNEAWILNEMHSDNTYFARNPLFGAVEQWEDIADFALPSSNGVTSNDNVTQLYRLYYLMIARTNQILMSIDEVEFDDEELKSNIKGQTLFLRAYAYFTLVRYFGSVPLHLIPVASREEAALPLAPVKDIYAQIIEDASTAIELLPPKSVQDPGRATSGAAKTVLANVYMVQEKWSQAETLLKEVVKSGEYALMTDYADAFSDSAGNKNNIESVFEVQFLEGSAGLNGSFLYNFMPRPISAEELVTITGTSNPQPLTGEANNIPTPDIINAYEEGDLREEASIGYITLSGGPWKDGTYPYIKKYARTHQLHGNHGMNWPIYRYSEVLLLYAEALAEQGKGGAVYLNIVRNRAGLDNYSGGDLLEAIYHERRVELAFENKRWFTLVRTGRAIEVMTAFGEKVKTNPQDYYYPEGTEPRGHAFNSITLRYPLPADEAALSPYF